MLCISRFLAGTGLETFTEIVLLSSYMELT